MKNSTRAISVAPPAMSPNPNTAARIATTRNSSAHLSRAMVNPPRRARTLVPAGDCLRIGCQIPPARSRRLGPALGGLRLVELHLEAAGHLEVGNEPVPVVGRRPGELDPLRLQLGDRLLDVVAVERDVGGAGRRAFTRVGRVAAHV